MDKNDLTNDIDDLNEFVADLGAMIAALQALEAKYMPKSRRVSRPLEHALASLKSGTVDLLLAADEIEGLAETISPPTT